MDILIIVIIVFLLSVLYGMKRMAEIVANDMYDQHRINASEYQYMITWNYITDMLQKEIKKYE